MSETPIWVKQAHRHGMSLGGSAEARGHRMKYHRPSRFRRIAKWVGLGVCGVITALWIVSLRWDAGIRNLNRVRAFDVWLNRGTIYVVVPGADYPLPSGRLDYELFMHRADYAYLTDRLTERIGLVGPERRSWRFFDRYRFPLWPLWLAVAIPTAILQQRDYRRKQGIRRSKCLHKVRLERLPAGTSLALSALTFAALLLIMPITFDALLTTLLTDMVGAELGALPTAPFVALLFLSILLPYLGMRFLYTKIRWRIILTDEPHCDSCGYNLSGNESGNCPECSTPVPKQETTA